MAKRIDFKHVRANGSIETVLAAYGHELTKDGSKEGQFKTLCPFHEDTKPSLKVNTSRGIFHCFACGAKGNVLEYVMKRDGLDIRPAAERVAEICGISLSAGGTKAAKPKSGQKAAVADRPQAKPETPADNATDADSEPYNRPLTFDLKLTQPDALMDWLASRGINRGQAKTFGLGQASARSKTLAGRLAIPIHDARGTLVAYCGRHIGDDVPEDVPKYVLPKGFHKDCELFNLHRLPEDCEYVVLFESYLSVIRHHDRVHAVSGFGRTISTAQIDLLERRGCQRVMIAFDGDQAGRDGARAAAGLLSERFWTRIVEFDDGVKPHHLSWIELSAILRSAWDSTQE